MRKINSRTNPRIKHLLKLKESDTRRESGLVVVYGGREVRQAWQAGVGIEELFVCPQILKQRETDFPLGPVTAAAGETFELSPEVSERIAFGKRDEGIVAVCRPRIWTLEEIEEEPTVLYLVVEQVEKPGNLGAILRTADGAGADAVFVCDGKTDVYNPNCIRASLGAVFHLPVVSVGPEELLTFLQGRGIVPVTASPAAVEDYTRCAFPDKVAVLVGSEEQGLTDFWLRRVQKSVRIPMLGKVDSLNVSVAAGILLYEVLRQRGREAA